MTLLAPVRPRTQGGWVVGLARGFGLLDDDGEAARSLGELWPNRSIRMNDGGCDPAGGFWLDASAVRDRRRFVDVEGGTPDGLTVDADGGVWVALYAGSAVHRYTPAGTLDLVVRVPTTHPMACGFGGPDLDELWITTFAQGAGAPDGRAGALYRCRPGIRGLEPLPYQG
ncbi:SMP-30/gluconolactonase/LRE family protein [Pseudonocardia sp.]|uniref:SMP-30/gluconolactonase/LRE family protein n=1 Tax=Pseudonocardia sp. TaxID=60912 RepID=UPI0031FC38D6